VGDALATGGLIGTMGQAPTNAMLALHGESKASAVVDINRLRILQDEVWLG
jgi:hypothetical protein